jgi:hypothetical protein
MVVSLVGITQVFAFAADVPKYPIAQMNKENQPYFSFFGNASLAPLQIVSGSMERAGMATSLEALLSGNSNITGECKQIKLKGANHIIYDFYAKRNNSTWAVTDYRLIQAFAARADAWQYILEKAKVITGAKDIGALAVAVFGIKKLTASVVKKILLTIGITATLKPEIKAIAEAIGLTIEATLLLLGVLIDDIYAKLTFMKPNEYFAFNLYATRTYLTIIDSILGKKSQAVAYQYYTVTGNVAAALFAY